MGKKTYLLKKVCEEDKKLLTYNEKGSRSGPRFPCISEGHATFRKKEGV